MTTHPLDAADARTPPADEVTVAAVLLDMDGTLVDSTAVVEPSGASSPPRTASTSTRC
ncbi:hypothetical protein ACT17Q_16155 [Cellulomonas sp. CW35]|uniref:hypothetical protein n=1 Tax=Cellulomonas sp. CW35 TaxID=3458249 RepID=UPI00403494CE